MAPAMTRKTGIVDELGEQALLLPSMVEQALVANEQAKYYFSLLQAARQGADHSCSILSILRGEREEARIDDPELDRVVPGAARIGDGRYRIAHLDRIVGGIQQAIEEMIEPFIVSGTPDAAAFCARRELLSGVLQCGAVNEIGRAGISAITSGDRSAGDSPHLLVMDLHRALNVLLERLVCEPIDGAQAYMLCDGDRELVRAFMRGLNRTAPLRFGHPGLGTIAVRAGDRLVIQNDIGVTEAHILMVTIVRSTVTISYTDVHLPRLAFFQSLFDEWEVEWSDTVSRPAPFSQDGGVYHLSFGRFGALDRDRCCAFLDYIGSRLVFLIDWNKARKQLRTLLPNRDAVAVLRDAAADEVGHRGFLELGGSHLIDTALDLAARGRLEYGEPLHRYLGREETMAYLAWVLRTASEGLLQGQPSALLQDRCRAELLRHFREARAGPLKRCMAHAALMVDVALALETSVTALRSGTETDRVVPNALLARRREREADLIASEVRVLSDRMGTGSFSDLIGAQDCAIDYLEDGCFYATALDAGRHSPASLEGLEVATGLAASAGRELLLALAAAEGALIEPCGSHVQESVAAAGRAIALADECDAAARGTRLPLIAGARALGACTGLVQSIEESAGALAKAAVLLRDGILAEHRP